MIEKSYKINIWTGETDMHKLLVFDLDGTLAQIGKGMLPADADKLIELEQMGYKIAICSGKSGFYLCGSHGS